MAPKPFHFKQFSIDHDRCTHKVGTDGVLLASWVKINDEEHMILDIGTGSGLMAIMLAQRTKTDVHIDAIEIETQDAQQAKENAGRSPWPEKITVIHGRIQDFSPSRRYELIVSNPPYFVNSLQPPEIKRSRARHTVDLSFGDLLDSVDRLLSVKGRLAIILPYSEARRFSELARNRSLFPHRRTAFRSRQHKPVERLLLEFGRKEKTMEQSEIVLYEEGDTWSPEYETLTRDFYIKV